MSLIDSHCHVSEIWYEPVEVQLFQMDRCGVDKAILVQIAGEYDNTYQFECINNYPGRFASVVGIDTHREDAHEELERLAEAGAVGVRLHAPVRSTGSDPLLIWRTAERLSVSVSVSVWGRDGAVSLSALDEFEELVSEFPRLQIVLEHLGGPPEPSGDVGVQLRERTYKLNRFPNVHMKFGGVGELAGKGVPLRPGHSFKEPIPRCHMMAYEAFGAERLMWSSNFPPSAHAEGYGRSFISAQEQFAGLTSEELNLMFFENANRLYFPN